MVRSANAAEVTNSKVLSTSSSSEVAEPIYRVPDGYVNRKMLREQANISEHDLKSLEGQGIIKAARKARGGWCLWSLAQVERVRGLAEEMRNRREARANTQGGHSRHLPAFRDHAVPYSLEEYEAVLDAITRDVARDRIPIETKVHPAIVKNILKDHSEMTGAILIAKPIVDAINALALPGVGSIRTADELFDALKFMGDEALEVKKCIGCKDETRTHCETCIRKLIARALKKTQKRAEQAPSDVPMEPNGTIAIPVTSPAPAGSSAKTTSGGSANPQTPSPHTVR